MTLPEPVREALDRAYKYRGLYSHGFLRWDELDAIRDHIATLTAEQKATDERTAHTNWLVRTQRDRIAELELAFVDYRQRAEKAEAERDALAQRCAAAEREVAAARQVAEGWNADARAEGFGGGSVKGREIIEAMDAAIHQETRHAG
jgi:predicted  nucleic acid-binding Zn-ribbon protein